MASAFLVLWSTLGTSSMILVPFEQETFSISTNKDLAYLHNELLEYLDKNDHLHFEGIIKLNIFLGSWILRPGG